MLFDTARAGFVAPMSLFLIDSDNFSTNSSSLNLFSSLASDISLIFIADSVVLMTQTILPSFLTIIKAHNLIRLAACPIPSLLRINHYFPTKVPLFPLQDFT